jgi:hypothetical protein
MSGRVDELTEGQKECLRLFYARYDAKEIARQLASRRPPSISALPPRARSSA